MRPRLREDVRYVPCQGGVYLHSDRGACTFEGTQLHAWLTRLEPFLTGENTLDELTKVLPGYQRDMVNNLVLTLYEQGFVTDARADRPHSLTIAECRIYAAEIAFIRYSLDSAEYRFQLYRQARVTLLGNGPVLTAFLEAGLQSGLRDMRVTGYDPAQLPQLELVVQRACRDGEQHIEIDDAAPLTDGCRPGDISRERNGRADLYRAKDHHIGRRTAAHLRRIDCQTFPSGRRPTPGHLRDVASHGGPACCITARTAAIHATQHRYPATAWAATCGPTHRSDPTRKRYRRPDFTAQRFRPQIAEHAALRCNSACGQYWLSKPSATNA